MKTNIEHITLLIDFYGELLTEKQKNYLVDYYFNDLTLSEIGEENSISKNAVYDSITKAIKELNNYEEKLNLIKSYQTRIVLYESIKDIELKNKLLETEVYNKWKKI